MCTGATSGIGLCKDVRGDGIECTLKECACMQPNPYCCRGVGLDLLFASVSECCCITLVGSSSFDVPQGVCTSKDKPAATVETLAEPPSATTLLMSRAELPWLAARARVVAVSDFMKLSWSLFFSSKPASKHLPESCPDCIDEILLLMHLKSVKGFLSRTSSSTLRLPRALLSN